LAPKVLKQQMVEVADESGQMMTLVKMIWTYSKEMDILRS
jgi:hypothetical protein